MAGHSKWAQIKRKKEANDAAKAKEFTKVTRMIVVAVQKGGPDPENNPMLSLAISKAREINMPKENVEKAINKATGNSNDKQSQLEEVTYEVYGPCNVSMLIDCTTDNKNRTSTEVRSVVEKSGGIFAAPGSISWQFKTEGRLLLEFDNSNNTISQTNIGKKWNEIIQPEKIKKNQSEEFVLEIIELEGVLDVILDELGIEIRTKSSSLHSIKRYIESKNIYISEFSIIKYSDNFINLSNDCLSKFESFLQKIENIEDVQNIWHNVSNL